MQPALIARIRAWSTCTHPKHVCLTRLLCTERDQESFRSARLKEQTLEKQRNERFRLWAKAEAHAAQRAGREEKCREDQSNRETHRWAAQSSGVPSPALPTLIDSQKSSTLQQVAKVGIITWLGIGCFTFAGAWAIAEWVPGTCLL